MRADGTQQQFPSQWFADLTPHAIQTLLLSGTPLHPVRETRTRVSENQKMSAAFAVLFDVVGNLPVTPDLEGRFESKIPFALLLKNEWSDFFLVVHKVSNERRACFFLGGGVVDVSR